MYPTEEELKIISEWSYKDIRGLLEYAKERWLFANDGYWRQEDNTYYLSTAGWSGNEDIIQALGNNLIFWSLCWHSSKRGGHYEFVLPKRFMGN
jgi:hypothetical protein